jgi:lipoate-protein ligase B
MRTLIVHNYGILPYKDAWDLQKRLVSERFEGKTADALLLLEHNHVITYGKNSDVSNLLVDTLGLKKLGIELIHTDRGGDITYHGPGQLIVYPIINLRNYQTSIKWYIHKLEQVIISSLKDFGIDSERLDKYPGVWVNNRKIASIGVRISRWITSHGIALNVNTDLEYFKLIAPCGIKDKDVTSMGKILGCEIPLETIKDIIVKKFAMVFGCKILL